MVSSLLLLAASQLSPQAAKPVCQFDRPALLALGVDAFDQDLKGGWRVIANKKGCEDEAAELIQQYREQQEGSLSILYWHEGQLRAFVGLLLLTGARVSELLHAEWCHLDLNRRA